jgi:hypothetical protein
VHYADSEELGVSQVTHMDHAAYLGETGALGGGVASKPVAKEISVAILENVDRRKCSSLSHGLRILVDDGDGHHLDARLHAVIEDDAVESERADSRAITLDDYQTGIHLHHRFLLPVVFELADLVSALVMSATLAVSSGSPDLAESITVIIMVSTTTVIMVSAATFPITVAFAAD